MTVLLGICAAVAFLTLLVWAWRQPQPRASGSDSLDRALRSDQGNGSSEGGTGPAATSAALVHVAPPIDAATLTVGDRVFHSTFRAGTVFEVDAQHLLEDPEDSQLGQ